jgi:NADPH-dependent 2,4-dienoyl-CoA reductase/sulfur reductase-like enzyme/nitrite reductase/ring-hydroxylating ferredoxin subunit
MDDSPKTSGPDLTKGVRVADLADGGRIAGLVGEDEVVLARSGDEFFALSAHCSHYSGPLAEGLVVGDTIHCPWHHACFSLRTGSALGAPAFRPLRVYKTTRDGDWVRVSAEAPPVPSSSVTTDAKRIVIVGGGGAGFFAASELRRLGYAGNVTLLTRDEHVPFDKPNLSKDYLAGRAPEEWIPLRSEEEYAAENIELRLRTSVESLDPDGGAVVLASGERLSYDRLILATGASPRRLDVKTDPSVPIHYLRTWGDAEEIRAVTEGARHVVIVGASFIGLETAASLRERGLNVTVIGSDARPLEKVFGRELADFVRRTHESHGVRFRLGRRPVEVRARAVLLDDGSAEACDVVIAGIGVTPELGLAERAGLAVEGGIVVDERLQTSAANIYAAGDVARFPWRGERIRVEHWAAAGRQGQLAARNAMGMHERFTAVPFFWSQHYDLTFAYVGHATHTCDAEIFGSLDEHAAAAVYRENGRITAVVTLFRDDVSLAVEAAMERDAGDDEVYDIVRRGFRG